MAPVLAAHDTMVRAAGQQPSLLSTWHACVAHAHYLSAAPSDLPLDMHACPTHAPVYFAQNGAALGRARCTDLNDLSSRPGSQPTSATCKIVHTLHSKLHGRLHSWLRAMQRC
eukprot:58026-Chlamydomonas_euryale.AAC.3